MSFNPEHALVGAVMVDAEAYWRVADIVTADDFADTECRELWTVIQDLAGRRQPFDPFTIGDREPKLYQAAIDFSATGIAANARAYAEIVGKRATERRVRLAGQRIAKLQGDDVLAEAQRLVGSCVPKSSHAVRRASDFAREALRSLIERHEATDSVTGVPTGIARLDELTAGWQRGNLVILGARPGLGKTALALQLAIHAARCQFPVFIASLEMTGVELCDRILSHCGEIDGQHIRVPKQMEDHEWPRLTAAKEELDSLPIVIDESSALTVDAICARVRQANATQRLGLVVIDYLTQIMPPKAEKMADAVQIITRQLKALAKELRVPVLLLSQLNRDLHGEPTLNNLRDSGAVEQDADIVMFLWRPEPEQRQNLIALTIAKQRNGPIGRVYLDAQMNIMRFVPTQYTEKVTPIRKSRGYGGQSYASRSQSRDDDEGVAI